MSNVVDLKVVENNVGRRGIRSGENANGDIAQGGVCTPQQNLASGDSGTMLGKGGKRVPMMDTEPIPWPVSPPFPLMLKAMALSFTVICLNVSTQNTVTCH